MLNYIKTAQLCQFVTLESNEQLETTFWLLTSDNEKDLFLLF